jgi:hypothetical protein
MIPKIMQLVPLSTGKFKNLCHRIRAGDSGTKLLGKRDSCVEIPSGE